MKRLKTLKAAIFFRAAGCLAAWYKSEKTIYFLRGVAVWIVFPGGI